MELFFWTVWSIYLSKSSCGRDRPDLAATLSNFSFPDYYNTKTQFARGSGEVQWRSEQWQDCPNNKIFRNWELKTSWGSKEGLLKTTVTCSWEGTDRTQFLWRKPSETEAHLHAAPLMGTSMSCLSGPRPRFKVSSQNQGLSILAHPPSCSSQGSYWKAENWMDF